MISGSEVIDPCPISTAADMMVIVPSVPMLIHGLSVLHPSAALRASSATLVPSSAMANDRPAAPIIN